MDRETYISVSSVPCKCSDLHACIYLFIYSERIYWVFSARHIGGQDRLVSSLQILLPAGSCTASDNMPHQFYLQCGLSSGLKSVHFTACLMHSHGCFTGSLNAICLKRNWFSSGLPLPGGPIIVPQTAIRDLFSLAPLTLRLSGLFHRQVMSTLSSKYWWSLFNSFSFTDTWGQAISHSPGKPK